MFDIFRQAPLPLTRRQNLTFAVMAIAVAATRFLSRARSPWDWDEALFQLGVQEYDVAHHQPHPPGYPIYILLAKFFRLFVHSDFHALQIVVLLGALLFFPAAFYFARELRFDFRTSLLGALIASFLPNVWYYGGTVFSDIPGVVSGLFASTLILRGCRDSRLYVLGAFVLGLSAGIRPQNLMTALVPALIATYIQLRVSWRSVVAGAFAGAIAAGGCYAGAALASESVDAYVKIMHIQQKYVHDIDSYHSAIRQPLGEVAQRTFLWPVGAPKLFTAIAILMLLSLVDSAVRRRPGPAIALISFLPFAIFTWLMLSVEAIPRYSVGYLIAYALLAADGIGAMARLLPQRAGAVVQIALSVALAMELGIWTWPAIATVRRTLSPPANAIRYIRQHAKPHQSTIFVHTGLSPQGNHDLADYDPVYFETDQEIPDAGFREPAFIFTPVVDMSEGGETFSFPRNRLWDIARRRNFEVSVIPAYRRVRFGTGWYGPEGDGRITWQWMGREGVVFLPPLPKRGRFTIRFNVPMDIEPKPPVLEVRINGVLIEHSICKTEEQRREWVIESRHDAKNEVRLSISDAPVPSATHASGDSRALGLELREFAWVPAP
jgi:hypothetical protein